MERITGTLSPQNDRMTGSLSATSQNMAGEIEKIPSHGILTGRSDPDQHPIEAISNLGPELSYRPDTAMSNADIYRILNS